MKVMYINLVTVGSSSEDIEQLPVIKISDDRTNKYISEGLEGVEAAILEIVEYLGKDHSELIPFAVEILESGKRKRRKSSKSDA